MSLKINTKEISLDNEGRYSLNDLHKAAGGDRKSEPNAFMRNESFKKMVNVLTTENPVIKPFVRKAGKYGGTWISKELVYKYAMWVSAEFEVKVIRTFDSLMSFRDSPLTMESLNELTLKIESNKDVASFCGKELNRYKKIKQENETRFNNAVKDVQLVLGFK